MNRPFRAATRRIPCRAGGEAPAAREREKPEAEPSQAQRKSAPGGVEQGIQEGIRTLRGIFGR
jgi:hypothetical protein